MSSNLQWNRTYAGRWQFSTDFGYCLYECTDGGFALGGESELEAWLVRTDSNGNLLWNETYDAGPILSIVEISGGGGDLALLSGDLLMRVEADGDQIWNRTYGDPYWDRCSALIECAAGGFAITGQTQTLGPGAIWLIRTDANGVPLWNRTYGENGWPTAIVEHSGGGFAIAGTVWNATTEYYDMLLLRTDDNGNHLWNHTYGITGTGALAAPGLVECASGGFAIAGPVALGAPSWLVRTDANGDRLWNKTYSGCCYSMVECSSGGFALSGNIGVTGQETNVWLLRTNEVGERLWECNYGDRYAQTAFAVTEVSAGGFALLGDTQTKNVSDLDDYQFWLLRVADVDGEPPRWVVAPEDQTLFGPGYPFSYDLDASDPAGLDRWWINDTSRFAINNEGTITNIVSLPQGSFGIRVSVNDTYNNVLTGDFRLTVYSGTPLIPGFPLPALLVGIAAALGIGLVRARHRQRRPS